jgi:hypothetical protein
VVELRLTGKVLKGTARAHVATESDMAEIVDFLSNRPIDAKAHGVALFEDGALDPESVRDVLPTTVLVRVTLDDLP